MAEPYTALYLSHGGGPMPLLGDPAHQEMVACLQQIAAQIPRPEALIVVSAHWECPQPVITSGQAPGLVYDYYGFPDEAYALRYPCPGNPGLAAAMQRHMATTGMAARLDAERGYDHGVFVPLSIMYPQADIPTVQLSLLNSLDAASHIALGEALRPVLDGKVLLIGSGFSFHNMQAFFQPIPPALASANADFEHWLQHTCSHSGYDEETRTEMLQHWVEAPGARFCHPREEHLLPLHVCYGAARTSCREVFSLNIMNKQSSMYLW